jgi:hypothetical protein
MSSKFDIVNHLLAPLGGKRTHPEKKRPHCVKVRLLRTSHNGLVRSTFSLFGMRFRKKYGTIGGNRTKEIELGGRGRSRRRVPVFLKD